MPSRTIEHLASGKALVARTILEALPEWFGRPDAREDYIAAADDLPTMVARDAAGAAIGFISIKRHTPVAAEVHVMGVLREHHGSGCGRAMVDAAAEWLAADGVRWLTVKTLGPDYPNIH